MFFRQFPTSIRSTLLALSCGGVTGAIINCSFTTEKITNWSNSHSFIPKTILRPKTKEEVEDIISNYHKTGEKLAIIGSGLSPNGIAYGYDKTQTALSLENLNSTIFIDKDRLTAKFQCGATVGQVVDELISHNLMLENLASINLQQLGGFYSVGAHGTGASIPPVEDQILEMTLVTPGQGTLTLSLTQNPNLFQMCKLGLGCFGVITDVTVRCIPLHNLKEVTSVITHSELEKDHDNQIRTNRHIKYMWIPFTDKVVIVKSNPTTTINTKKSMNETNSLGSMQKLFSELFPNRNVPLLLNFADLRTELLAYGNLNLELIKRINLVELEYHESCQGEVIKRCDHTMAFDCGGQQLVLEICFKQENGNDIRFVQRLLKEIERQKIPAPIPIEHRFTAAGQAKLSPCKGENQDVFAWIGVVMYIPVESEKNEVKEAFAKYSKVVNQVAKEMNLEHRIHWAKLEIPKNQQEVLEIKKELALKYPLEEFNLVRKLLDPKQILSTPFHELLKG